MKILLSGALLLIALVCPLKALAWDGFDADSADLVQIKPETEPQPGYVVSVTNYDKDTTTEAIVLSVRHNLRTIEVVVQYPDNSVHTLVMEGR